MLQCPRSSLKSLTNAASLRSQKPISTLASSSHCLPFYRYSRCHRDLLEGLHKVGFRTHLGPDGAGYTAMGRRRGGGYYLDVGASRLVIDGKIKLKNDAQISTFSEKGLEFDNGSHLDADVVIFVTGYGDAREPSRKLLGEDVGQKLKPIWGLDSKGELNSAWRDVGIPRLYCMMGTLFRSSVCVTLTLGDR